ncbi:MAG: BrnA antitoxin family protein [Treponema sp.]|jgi:uncharacterized protein (DUF4415 family)|nr:BrnA antitoxin family protein [Treponema sp.]
MGIVRTISDGTEPLTEEDLQELEALKTRPIDYSDIPNYSREEIREMRRYAEEKRKEQRKKMFSLRLETSTVDWWKSLGEGYTALMAKFLDSAKKHPEWVKECL